MRIGARFDATPECSTLSWKRHFFDGVLVESGISMIGLLHLRSVPPIRWLRAVMFISVVAGWNSLLFANQPWGVTWQNAIELDRNQLQLDELSGLTTITRVNQQADLYAISDENGVGVRLSVSIDMGGIATASATATFDLVDESFDTEGIAFNASQPGHVFVAYERDSAANEVIPGIRQYNVSTGEITSVVDLPSIWETNGNTIINRGFESLAWSAVGRTMWTANEEALTIDGDLATEQDGTVVRLQQLIHDNGDVLARKQFAYEVDPVHGSNADRSGLVDLVVLPDGNLLALERSAALAEPIIENRIYQVDFSGATDISDSTFDSGLYGASFTPVTKTLLWSGAAGGTFGANMEGLTVGPRTANGDWSLIGAVDNGGGNSGNLIVGFELTPPAVYGDFDRDGEFSCADIDSLVTAIVGGLNDAAFDLTGDGQVDGEDQLEWLSAAGLALDFAGPVISGDANLDGVVDTSDFNTWNANKFTQNSAWCSGDFNHDGFVDSSDFNVWNSRKFTSVATAVAVPEPSAWMVAIAALWLVLLARWKVGIQAAACGRAT